MQNKLEHYNRVIEELHRQIELYKLYKDKIHSSLEEINKLFLEKQLDETAYRTKVNKFLKNRSPEQWFSYYDSLINKTESNIKHYESQVEKVKNSHKEKKYNYSRLFMIVGIIALIMASTIVIRPSITGLIPYAEEAKIVSEDGYTKEGTRWMNINGLRNYERCLQVNSDQEFDSIKIIAKITSALDTKDLIFNLYANHEVNQEPLDLLGSCKVADYNDLWKYCTINNLKQPEDNYWICAANPSGDSDKTYYTIAYQKGDPKKTALWTGQNWQKLNRTSYTIKAQFLKNE